MKFKYLKVSEKGLGGPIAIQRVDVSIVKKRAIWVEIITLQQTFPPSTHIVCLEESNQELPTFMAKPSGPSAVQLIGNKILTAGDLEAMNRAEIKARAWQYCTVETPDRGDFLATVAFSEKSGAWEPKEVLYEDEWISIGEFESSHEGGVCSFKYYRRFK